MRGIGSTVAAAIVLVLLGGYIYVYEWGEPPSLIEEKEKAFQTIEPDRIEEIRITAAGGETSRATKTDAGWQLVEPEKAEGDASELSGIASSLGSLEMQRVVDENATDLARYGLNPPRVEVAFRLKDEKELRRLLLGEKTPTGSDLYAKRQGDNAVFLVSSFLDNTFNRTPFDLRDKSILEFDREKVDSVEIASGASTLQFVRSGTDWKIARPIAARGDYGTIEGLVTRLSSGQMQRIVDASPGDLKKYGLDRPAATATVSAGSARATLLVGTAEGGSAFAKDASRPMVFAVEESLATDLEKPLGDFRRKDVFDFRAFNATRVEIARGAATLVFEKTKDTDGKEIWKNAAGQPADTTKVEDLLTKLSNLRAQSFDTDTPSALLAPELTVTAAFDGRSETVQLGRSGGSPYAIRADEPGAATLETTPYEDVIKALEAVTQ